jgi:hypothetical protein
MASPSSTNHNEVIRTGAVRLIGTGMKRSYKMSNVLGYVNANAKSTAGGSRVQVMPSESAPVLACPVVAFAAIGFGMYTVFNKCFG